MLSSFGRFRVDPFAEMRRLQDEVNRLFSHVTATAAARDNPPINLWLGDNSVVVTAQLPGVTRDELTISPQDDLLTLQGQRRGANEPHEIRWHRRERSDGPFSRAVQLPFRADPDKVQARFNGGILEIELVRPEADRPRKIAIRAE